MKEEMKIIRKYLDYRDSILHKKDMGYPISQSEFDTLAELKEKALIAKEEIKKESREIKRILRKIK